MTEMLDRATMAVLEIWQKSNAPVGTHFDCEAVARAVIEAMQVPTDAMVKAAEEIDGPSVATVVYGLMIEAALTPPRNPRQP